MYIAGHMRRVSEYVMDIWEKNVMYLEGFPTRGAMQPMSDAGFATGREYNTQESIQFLKDRLDSIGIGTHKRSHSSPIVWEI